MPPRPASHLEERVFTPADSRAGAGWWSRWRGAVWFGAVWLGVTFAGPVARGQVAAEVAPDPTWAALRAESFRLVGSTVAETFYDPAFGGLDWAAEQARFAPRIERAGDAASLREVLNELLATLGRTHFSVWPGSAAEVATPEAAGLGTLGIELTVAEQEVVAFRIQPESPAARAGVRPGDVVATVDGMSVAAMHAALPTAELTAARRDFYLVRAVEARRQPAPGVTIPVTWVRGPSRRKPVQRETVLTAVAYTGAWSTPLGHMPAMPLTRELSAPRRAPAYVRFNLFVPSLMDELRAFVRALPPATPGLIIDLRGNPGGIGLMAAGLAGWLVDEPFSLGTMQMRSGHLNFAVFPQEGAFLGPVAVLIDARSASTSELLAAGLREAGRARVFGEVSAGAALPSLFQRLPTGDVFQYAVADLRTPGGTLLEGRGAEPDVVIAPKIADLAAGRDPARAAATAWLHSEMKTRRPPRAP